MTYFPFIWKGETSLAHELTMPFRELSLHLRWPLWEPSSLTFRRNNGSDIIIYSQMHDVAERLEVGALTFELVTAYSIPENDRVITLSKEFDAPITASKLLISESENTLESGIILKAANGFQIIIVAGVSPYTIAIQGVADDLPRIFNPEYPLEDYKIIPITH